MGVEVDDSIETELKDWEWLLAELEKQYRDLDWDVATSGASHRASAALGDGEVLLEFYRSEFGVSWLADADVATSGFTLHDEAFRDVEEALRCVEDLIRKHRGTLQRFSEASRDRTFVVEKGQVVYCVAEGVYGHALTRGQQYEVEAVAENSSVRVRGDNGRTRWFPPSCFASSSNARFR